MIVVGGAYDEACADPPLDWTFGSGVRAAAVVGEQCKSLVTAADPDSLARIHAVLGTTKVEHIARSGRIRFAYDTPLSPPNRYSHPLDVGLDLPEVVGGDALVFGMVEATPRVSVSRAVVDPQHSLSLEGIRAVITSDDLVVIANERELQLLAGDLNLGGAANTVLRETGASAVVVKAGAAGALVITLDEVVGVQAIPTKDVWPIGSGDVFTAAFALAYFDGASAVVAANIASERAAGYCATRQVGPVTMPSLYEVLAPTIDTLQDPPRVYVAASFDTPEQRWSARTAARGIDDVGGKSFYPLRDVGPVRDQAVTAKADLEGLAECASVLVLADAARTGPFFEAGWATRAGIPVIVASSDPDPTRFTMLRGSGATIVRDLSTAVYHSIWLGLRHRQAEEAG